MKYCSLRLQDFPVFTGAAAREVFNSPKFLYSPELKTHPVL